MIAINLNGASTPLPAEIKTLSDLIDHLGWTNKRIAVECNLEIVPRTRHAQTFLAAGDNIEIVQAIGGG
jgi:sulfur carrier protein